MNENRKRLHSQGEKKPFFEAPDNKILAVGDMFRGPYTGISSVIDLNDASEKSTSEEELTE
jgi:hypothetical protein